MAPPTRRLLTSSWGLVFSTARFSVATGSARRLGLFTHLDEPGPAGEVYRYNLDLLARAEQLGVDTAWVARAVRGVDKLSSGQRRNINRQLALDSLGLALTGR